MVTIPATSTIAAVVDQVEGLAVPDPDPDLPSMCAVLAQVVDPRGPSRDSASVRGRAHLAVGAVAAGARSFVAIAEWVADLPAAAAEAIGVVGRCPSESTLRRIVQAVDADRFDAVLGGYVQRFTAVHEAFWAAARAVHGDAAGTRALIEVLLLHRRLRRDAVLAGIRAALAVGSVSADVVAVEARKHATTANAVTGAEAGESDKDAGAGTALFQWSSLV